ncbi:MAG: SRPBCC family protein [Candidatus Limnocylindrales bacterium]
MIEFNAEQTIDRPADEIWAYAADIGVHPQWMNVRDATVVKGTGVEVGAIGRETVQLGPRRYVTEIVVSEATPGRAIAWRVTGGAPIAGETRLELVPIGPESTRVRWTGHFSLTGLWRLLEPVVAGEIRSGGAAELVRLKTVLEAPASAPAVA